MTYYSKNKFSLSIVGLLLGCGITALLFQNYAIHQLEPHEANDLASTASSGIYDLVSALSSPNIGVHWGKVENNQAAVDRIVNIDPSSSEDVKNSTWYLTQWKKKSPLMLNNSRKDPIETNSSYRDRYLGKPIFEINSPRHPQFGIETSLLIFKDPTDQANVFEIVGRNGYLNQFGGSNVFLTGALSNENYADFSNEISLTFKGKLSRLNMTKTSSARDAISIGFVLTGFTAQNTDTKDSLFVQIAHADTRKSLSEYRGCYMHGQNLEIVYSNNLDGDFKGVADPANAPLKSKSYNLNRYLCAAIKGNFKCPAGVPAGHFSSLRNDLSKWRFTGFYTGAETQSSRAPEQDPEKPGISFGQVEVGYQYSGLRVSANTNRKYLNCDDVEQGRTVTPDIPKNNCSQGTFKNSAGETIQYFCGCGTIPGGHLQADGCYHKAR